jgi:hypothetical protein
MLSPPPPPDTHAHNARSAARRQAAIKQHPPPTPHCSQHRQPWAVNCTVAQPGGGRLLCTVGDHPEARVYEAANGRQVAALSGHLDYSFAAAWHPDGNVVATGNQVGPAGCCQPPGGPPGRVQSSACTMPALLPPF